MIGLSIVFLGLLVIGFISGPLGQSFLGDIGLPEWLSLPQPHPRLPAETIFHTLGFPITNSIIATWVTVVFLVIFSWAVTRRMKLVPGRLQAIFEALLGWLLSFCESVAGERNGRRFFPIIATIFLFVLFNAWLSLIPGFVSITAHTAEGETELLRGANTDLNTPLALALVSFIFVEYYGLRSLGFRYLKKFANFGLLFSSFGLLFRGRVKSAFGGLFLGFVNIFVGIVETLSEFIRIVSFTFRLFGNMTAGEILLLLVMYLVPFVVALPFYGLELLVGFIQALIFGGLTLVFASMAVTPHEEESEH
ncbi:MAG: F0F1 ATP synthase subunit A [Chloroflexi bacterium]|nr:F0F1 ATP synthase subunit A [Chloroflexota bacterium]